MRKYSVVSGAYIFPADDCQVQVRNVSRDRFGRIYGDLAILTLDGVAYLAKDSGCLSQGDYRRRVASQAASRNSGDTLRVENLLMDCLLALEQDPNIADTTPGPAPLPVQEWLRTVRPPSPEVVAGLLERGGLYLVGAKPKAGKTILLLNLALSVAQGTTWLGRTVTPGKVVMFQLEDSDRTLKRRLERMVLGAWPDDLWLQVTPFRLTLDNYDSTVQACRGASLILCDPVILASAVRDWNAQQDVRDAFDLWRRLARNTDAAVVLSAHHRKMSGTDGDQVAGSIQALATVDGILELYRDPSLEKTERRLALTGRDWSDMEDEVLRLDTETLTWDVAGSYRETRETARQERQAEKAREVWAALPDTAPGMTYEELARATETSRDRVREGIKALGDQVVKVGKAGSRTNPLRFLRAATGDV